MLKCAFWSKVEKAALIKRESVRLGLKGSDRGAQLTDKARIWEQDRELWSSDLSRLGQGYSHRAGNHKSGNSGQVSSSREYIRSLGPDRMKTAV